MRKHRAELGLGRRKVRRSSHCRAPSQGKSPRRLLSNMSMRKIRAELELENQLPRTKICIKRSQSAFEKHLRPHVCARVSDWVLHMYAQNSYKPAYGPAMFCNDWLCFCYATSYALVAEKLTIYLHTLSLRWRYYLPSHGPAI